MILELVLRAIVLVSLLGAPQQPRDPASLGYVALQGAPNPVREPAFSDLPADPSSDDPKWLADQRARIDRDYGPIGDYTKDLGMAAVTANLQRATRALRQSSTFETPNGRLLRASLEAEFVQTQAELGALSGRIVPPEFGSRLQPTHASQTAFDADIVFFVGTDRQVIFRASQTKEGTKQLVYYATPEQAFEFREARGRVFAIASQIRGAILQELSLRLADLNQAWDNYLVHGFSQYPWESYVNAYVTPNLFGQPSWYDPPKDQLVFLHPELGMLMDLRRRSDADVLGALFVDAVGYVHYFGEEDRGWFLGVSAAVSLSDDSLGLGIGPMLHFGNSGRGSQLPNVSVGMFWHEPEDGRDGVLLGISLDLWRLFDKSGPEGVFRAALPAATR